jgi:hypothetical protein
MTKKYKETLLDAAETVLEYFGFDRTAYGNGRIMRARKCRWLQEIKQEQQRDTKAEIEGS